MTVKKKKTDNSPTKKSLFDHVKHIRQVQDPTYYVNLSDEDRKSFNVFMIIRALAMDDYLVEDMASLYQYLDNIPPAQFYTLLITMVPRSNGYSPWIKSKRMKHNKELLNIVAKKFQVSKYQSNEYINVLLRTDNGQSELIRICKSYGLDDGEVNKLFEEQKYD